MLRFYVIFLWLRVTEHDSKGSALLGGDGVLDESLELPRPGASLPFGGAGLALVSQRFLKTSLFHY